MANVIDAVRIIETLYLDEFKAACRDKIMRPVILLDLHKYFRYQTKVYTFSSPSHIPKVYNELRLGKITPDLSIDNKDTSYTLTFLTELSQRMVMELMDFYSDAEVKPSPGDIIHELSLELAQSYCLHTDEQDYIKDPYYQTGFDKDEWVNIFVANPWLLVGALIRYTSTDLTDSLYVHLGEAKDLLRELDA